jgi:hypothetical protein
MRRQLNAAPLLALTALFSSLALAGNSSAQVPPAPESAPAPGAPSGSAMWSRAQSTPCPGPRARAAARDGTCPR